MDQIPVRGVDLDDYVPLVEIIEAFRRDSEGFASPPGQLHFGAAPAVQKLDPGNSAERSDEIGDAAEWRNESVVPNPEVGHRPAAAPFDCRPFLHDKRGAARRHSPQMHEVPVGRKEVSTGILPHRRRHHAVSERHAAKDEG